MENSIPIVFWFTGLPAAGKTTIAHFLEHRLRELNLSVVCLDGDDVRHTMSKDLGFSDEDRAENSRRVAEVSKLLAESDFVVIASLISPLRLDRKIARSILKGTFFVETFIDAPIEVCERRDPKKLYAKARRGEIQQFTGIDSRFEAPSEPELQINTTNLTIEQSVNMILEYMENEIFDRKSNAINRSLGWC